MNPNKSQQPVQIGTYKEFSYQELKRNPQNPRRLFDKEPLSILKESIKHNGILVPLTVYQEKNTEQYYILDGERRWVCAELIETDPHHPQKVPIPANVVDPPTPVANILWMFNIHNLREQWELMPTALSLRILMKKLDETDDNKIAELTKLSEPRVRQCRTLLTYDSKYHDMMLVPDPQNRIKANFFIELYPVLEFYMKFPSKIRGGKTRNELIDHFLLLYKAHKISSVVHFRRILEAYDCIKLESKVVEGKKQEFEEALQKFATTNKYSIRQLFDPFTTENKSVNNALSLCEEFLTRMRKLKIEHTVDNKKLKVTLYNVQQYISDLLNKLES